MPFPRSQRVGIPTRVTMECHSRERSEWESSEISLNIIIFYLPHPMGDILDLFLDFERKLLALLRDMFVRPLDVIVSIQAKDKKYLGSFKFYSLVFSLWLVLIRLTNSWLVFYRDEWMLPKRLHDFAQSQIEFSFFIAPFLGLVEFFLPIGLLNFFFFRRSGYSMVTHLSFATAIGGVIMLYYLPIIYVINLLTASSWSQTAILLTGLPLLGLPAIFTTYIYVRVFSQRKWLSAFKGIVVVGGSTAFTVLLLSSFPVDDFLHKNIFYRKYARFELTSNVPRSKWNEKFSPIQEDPLFFQSQTSKRSHPFVGQVIDGDSIFFSLVIEGRSDTIERPIVTGAYFGKYARFITTDLDSFILVSKTDLIFDGAAGMAWLFDHKANLLGHNNNIPNINPHSIATAKGKQLYITGVDFQSKVPLIGTTTDIRSGVTWTPFPNLENFLVDKMSEPDSTGSFQAVIHHTANNRLREIRWLVCRPDSGIVHVNKELTLYKNDFSPTENGRFDFFHRSELLQVDDQTSIVTFQVMTDSSFTLDVTRIDVPSGKQVWNKTHTVDADMAFFQHAFYHDGRIIALGTATSLFQKGIMTSISRYPFMMEIDATTGNRRNTWFLPQEEELFDLEYYYKLSSGAYISDGQLLWNADSQKAYIISIDSL